MDESLASAWTNVITMICWLFSHPVQGHVTSSGTYVPPHQQTNPNSTERDNFR
jgi:hypothetical protein